MTEMSYPKVTTPFKTKVIGLILIPIESLCDFILVNNKNLHGISHLYLVKLSDKLSPLTRGAVLGNLCEYRHKLYITKS